MIKPRSWHAAVRGAAVAFLVQPCSLLSAQTTEPAARSSETILTEIESAHRQFKQAVTDPSEISDPQKRQAIAPQAIPPLKTMVADFQELAAVQPQSREHANQLTIEFNAFLSVLGDQPTINALQAQAASTDIHESLRGQASQLLARWVLAGKDQQAQGKLTDELQVLDTGHPDNIDLTFLTMTVSQSTLSKPLAARLVQLACGMHNPVADKVRAIAATTRP